jgi:hypothetical protein
MTISCLFDELDILLGFRYYRGHQTIEFALQDTRKIAIVFFSRGGDAMPPIIRGASRYQQEPAHRAYRKFRCLLWDPGVLPGNSSCVALDRLFPTRSTSLIHEVVDRLFPTRSTLPFLGLVPPASLPSTVDPWQSLS